MARAEYEAAYERLVGEIAVADARLLSLGEERDILVQAMAPLVDRQVEDARQLLGLGEGGALILLESIVRAHETKIHLLDVRLDEATAVAELNYLLGPIGAAEADHANNESNTPHEVSP